jgi:hypothetical protein
MKTFFNTLEMPSKVFLRRALEDLSTGFNA